MSQILPCLQKSGKNQGEAGWNEPEEEHTIYMPSHTPSSHICTLSTLPLPHTAVDQLQVRSSASPAKLCPCGERVMGHFSQLVYWGG